MTDGLDGGARPATSGLTSPTADLAAELRAADEDLDALCERFAGLRELWLRDEADTRGDVSGVRRALHERLAAAGERLARAREADPTLADAHAAEWTRELAARIQLAALAPELYGDHQTRLFDGGHPDREAAHIDHVMDGATDVAQALYDLQHYRGISPPVVGAVRLHGAAQLALQSVLQHRSVNRFFRLHDQSWVADFRARPDGDRVWESLLEDRLQTVSTRTARDEHTHDMAGGDPALAARFDELATVVRRGVTANLDETDPIYGPVRALVDAAPADRQAFLRTLDRRGDYDAFATYCGPLYLALREGTSYSADPVVDRRGVDGVLADAEMLGGEMAEAGADLIESIENLAQNGGELVAGVLEGMASTGLDNPAVTAALQSIVAGLAAIALGPATLGGVAVGIADAVAADVELIAGILEDPVAFGEQVIAIVEAMCSADGAELARALGHDMGRELCADIVAMADLSALELAFEVGHLGGTIAWEIVKSLIGAGIAARIARFARSSAVLRTLLPEPRRVPGLPAREATPDAGTPSSPDRPAHEPPSSDLPAYETTLATGAPPAGPDLETVIDEALDTRAAGRISQLDYAKIYSATDGATARTMLDQAIARHEVAAASGEDFVTLARALSDRDLIVEGTVEVIEAAATPIEQHAILENALELAERITVHATAHEALADFLRRVAANPQLEYAIHRIRFGQLLGQRGEFVVVTGEAASVPSIYGTLSALHNHPPNLQGLHDALTSIPSLVDDRGLYSGDAGVGFRDSIATGTGHTQTIMLSTDGSRTALLHTDAHADRLWFDLTTPDGRPIHVTRQGSGLWEITVGFDVPPVTTNTVDGLIGFIEYVWNPLSP